MRTTLTFEEDVFAAAKSFAASRSISLGKAVSELIRRGLENQRTPQSTTSFPTFTVTQNATTITPEDVKRFEDDE